MRVGIVGAGITGLALTHHLAVRGVESVALEAAENAGGVIQSERVDGVVLERGPQRMRLTPAVESLVEAAGITEALRTAEELPLYVYANGRLGEVPFDRGTFLATDLLSWRGKLRLLAEPLTRAGRGDESVATVFRRKFGEEAYRNVFGPLYGGIYGSDPAKMPARHALAGLLEAESKYHSLLRAFLHRVGSGRQFSPISFDGGLQQLPEELAHRYDDRIRLGTPATGIFRDDGGYRIETPAGTEPVDSVVITAPGPDAAGLLENAADGANSLVDLTYNPLAMVYLRAEVDREGLGYQVRYGEDLHTLGVSWNAQMFDRDQLYTAFLGGMDEPEIVDRDGDTLGRIAAREFETVTGAAASVVDVHRLEQGFPAYDRSWDALETLDLPDGVTLATNYTARMGVPSRIREAADLAESLATGSVTD